MSWLLTYTDHHSENKLSTLDLTHAERGSCLRQWYGPVAKYLFQLYLKKNLHGRYLGSQSTVKLNKQDAQSFLIESCLYQQNLLQHFFVTQDLSEKKIKLQTGMSDVLLFIRMSQLHLSQDTLDEYINLNMTYTNQAPCLDDLVNHKLIQKIQCFGISFYDKNPYPHHHIFDTQTQTLKDYDFNESPSGHQHIVLSHNI